MRQPNCGRITRSPGAVSSTIRIDASMLGRAGAERDRAGLVDAQRERDAAPDEVGDVGHALSREPFVS